MARCLRIVFGIMAGLVVFVVTCSCIIPFDCEEIPDREPIGVVVSPNRINCTINPEEEDGSPCMVKALSVLDDGSTDSDIVWDVPPDAICVLSTAGGILTFRVPREGTHTIRAMTLPYMRKDREVVSAECQIVAVSPQTE